MVSKFFLFLALSILPIFGATHITTCGTYTIAGDYDLTGNLNPVPNVDSCVKFSGAGPFNFDCKGFIAIPSGVQDPFTLSLPPVVEFVNLSGGNSSLKNCNIYITLQPFSTVGTGSGIVIQDSSPDSLYITNTTVTRQPNNTQLQRTAIHIINSDNIYITGNPTLSGNVVVSQGTNIHVLNNSILYTSLDDNHGVLFDTTTDSEIKSNSISGDVGYQLGDVERVHLPESGIVIQDSSTIDIVNNSISGFAKCGLNFVQSGPSASTDSITVTDNAIVTWALIGSFQRQTPDSSWLLAGICIQGVLTDSTFTSNKISGDSQYLIYSSDLTQFDDNAFNSNQICSTRVLANPSYVNHTVYLPLYELGVGSNNSFTNNSIACTVNGTTTIQPYMDFCGALSDCGAGARVIDGGNNISTASTQTNYPLTPITSVPTGPIISAFTVTPSSITSSQNVTLAWTVPDTTAIISIPEANGYFCPHNCPASTTYFATKTQTFHLAAITLGGTTLANATVTFSSPTGVVTCASPIISIPGNYFLNSDLACGLEINVPVGQVNLECNGHTITASTELYGIHVHPIHGSGSIKNCIVQEVLVGFLGIQFDGFTPLLPNDTFLITGNTFLVTPHAGQANGFFDSTNLIISNNQFYTGGYALSLQHVRQSIIDGNTIGPQNLTMIVGMLVSQASMIGPTQNKVINNTCYIRNGDDDCFVVGAEDGDLFDNNSVIPIGNPGPLFTDCGIEFVNQNALDETKNSIFSNNKIDMGSSLEIFDTSGNLIPTSGVGRGICGYGTSSHHVNLANNSFINNEFAGAPSMAFWIGIEKNGHDNLFVANHQRSSGTVLATQSIFTFMTPLLPGGNITNNLFAENDFNFVQLYVGVPDITWPQFSSSGYTTAGIIIDGNGNKCSTVNLPVGYATYAITCH